MVRVSSMSDIADDFGLSGFILGMGNFFQVLWIQAVFVEFGAAHAQAHAEVGAHGLAYGGHDLYAESHAVFKRAAVFVIAEIGAGAPELVDQVLVGGRYFHAVHAGPLDALRGLGEVAPVAADFLPFYRSR